MVTQIRRWGEITTIPDGATIFYKEQDVEPNSPSGDGYVVGQVINAGRPDSSVAALSDIFLDAVIKAYNSQTMEEIREAGKGYGWQDKLPSHTRVKQRFDKIIIFVDAPVPELRELAEKFAVALEERLKE